MGWCKAGKGFKSTARQNEGRFQLTVASTAHLYTCIHVTPSIARKFTRTCTISTT